MLPTNSANPPGHCCYWVNYLPRLHYESDIPGPHTVLESQFPLGYASFRNLQYQTSYIEAIRGTMSILGHENLQLSPESGRD
ncbi:hypothetical protein VFPPC_15606 [Pochonia chlamydosporia 170]|uniref:Uncharacterized protein n=1 Tax=Pochonia chlamydosporia 170 TaxID=1380566 RepID=A0A179G0B6_METCM|nr:hypothetical protein VFPPC_15606 [Pochonia chlamydosporia 170]OAQ70669.1 hypothetical protein VFPPC_15606 [Pochonia chlamydosporia 170]